MVLLSSYAAKRCPRRVHNEWDPTIPTVEWAPPAEIQMRLDAGQEFEDEALARLRAALRPDQYVDLREVGGRTEAVEATLAAMDAGTEVVIGGWLPDDPAGGRKGRPDLLVREAEGPGYQPGEVKGHRMARTSKRGRLAYSTLDAPTMVVESEGLACGKSDRIDDYLQLAHYWRMLEACGHAAAEPQGLVVGTDELPDLVPAGLDSTVLVRLDLTGALFATYSRSRGKVKRSALERYDHEQAFRLRVAEVAASRTGAAEDPEPLVEPIFVEECKSCPWFDYCLEVAGPDAPSARLITGSFSRREWLALEQAGCSSVEALAQLDPGDEGFWRLYEPEVTHVPGAAKRLQAMVQRARMVVAGVRIERTTTGPIEVPRADVEIDFDIEWAPDNRVYLWGALVRRPGAEPAYRSIVSWEPLDEQGERRLATKFVTWLREILAEHGPGLLVYHYSPAEVCHLRRVLGADAVADLLVHFVDLHEFVRQNYVGVDGLGIKQVAPEFGFAWRDESPSGLQSQLWLGEARDSTDPATAGQARRRLLEYNEDDVAATAALREGLARER